MKFISHEVTPSSPFSVFEDLSQPECMLGTGITEATKRDSVPLLKGIMTTKLDFYSAQGQHAVGGLRCCLGRMPVGDCLLLYGAGLVTRC